MKKMSKVFYDGSILVLVLWDRWIQFLQNKTMPSMECVVNIETVNMIPFFPFIFF